MHRRILPLLLALGLGACPGKEVVDDSAEACSEGYQVYVVWEAQEGCATECPEGTFEGYTDGDLLVCNRCETDDDCDSGQTCAANCGPGCEDDTEEAGCCPVFQCEG